MSRPSMLVACGLILWVSTALAIAAHAATPQRLSEWHHQQRAFLSKSPTRRSGDRGAMHISRHETLRSDYGEARIDLDAVVAPHVVRVDSFTTEISKVECVGEIVAVQMQSRPADLWFGKGTILSIDSEWGCDEKAPSTHALRKVVSASWNDDSLTYTAQVEEAAFNECFESLQFSMAASDNERVVVKQTSPPAKTSAIRSIVHDTPSPGKITTRVNDSIVAPTLSENLKMGDTVTWTFSLKNVDPSTVIVADVMLVGIFIDVSAHNKVIKNEGVFSWTVDSEANNANIYLKLTYPQGCIQFITCNSVTSTNLRVGEAKLGISQPDGTQVIRTERSFNVVWDSQNIKKEYPLTLQILDQANNAVLQTIPVTEIGGASATIPDAHAGKKVLFKVTDGKKLHATSVANDVSRVQFESPFVGQRVEHSKSFTIRWSTSSAIAPTISLRFTLKKSDGSVSLNIGSYLNSASEFSYTLPESVSYGQYNILMYRTSDSALLQTSPLFNVPEKHISFLEPDGQQTYSPKEVVNVKWSSTSIPANEMLTLSVYIDEFFFDTKVDLGNVPNSGSFLWTVPDNWAEETCYFRIDVSGFTFYSEKFVISRTRIISPEAGKHYRPGTKMQLSWSSSVASGQLFKFYLVKDIPLYTGDRVYLGESTLAGGSMDISILEEWASYFPYYISVNVDGTDSASARFHIPIILEHVYYYAPSQELLQDTICKQECTSELCDLCDPELREYVDLDMNFNCPDCKVTTEASFFNLNAAVYMFNVKDVSMSVKGSVVATLDMSINVGADIYSQASSRILQHNLFGASINLGIASFDCYVAFILDEQRTVNITASGLVTAGTQISVPYELLLQYPSPSPTADPLDYTVSVVYDKEPTIGLMIQGEGTVEIALIPAIEARITSIMMARGSAEAYVSAYGRFQAPAFAPGYFDADPIFQAGACDSFHYAKYLVTIGFRKPAGSYELLTSYRDSVTFDYDGSLDLVGGCIFREANPTDSALLEFTFNTDGFKEVNIASLIRVLQRDLGITLDIPDPRMLIDLIKSQIPTKEASKQYTARIRVMPEPSTPANVVANRFEKAVQNPKSALYDGMLTKSVDPASAKVDGNPVSSNSDDGGLTPGETAAVAVVVIAVVSIGAAAGVFFYRKKHAAQPEKELNSL
eukprot:TRINITY_DN2538_c0_g1_i19.p1 TRINITY_DN2538_c0_g1~~TRINITY_DN2538_c0_g1_i19.p1  ORF type:complete len:1155 (-),score=245.93 TRINITY_DN2538_c0_g1_i19:1243-4707(-)